VLPLGTNGQTLVVDTTTTTGLKWTAPNISPWSVQTADFTMSVNNSYIFDKVALLTATLPVTSAIGTTIEITSIGAGGWRISQGAGQIIHVLGKDTTAGIAGRIDSTQIRDSIKLVCVVADLEWNAVYVGGNPDII
jgi:hypothetical protein